MDGEQVSYLHGPWERESLLGGRCHLLWADEEQGAGEVTDGTQITSQELTRSHEESGFGELQGAPAFCFTLLTL